ncbi:MAG TPA: biopolymer transporter ExbD [Nitrospinota bacterium]|jgi:biopolymer transport protein ExbD|nr:biopolymer transporter ExbD [Nitrospinota bacterium]|tara:strand:- start:266 stop:682 length:417 start_codon:yes stop_codon:yes gene_type:complete
MEFKGRKRMQSHINVLPLIDIVFLLLIFFMLTSNFLNQAAIKLELPEASNATEEKEEEIVLSIDKDKKIFIGAESFVISDLPVILKEKLEKASRKNVIIKGDRNIDLGLTVKVMDIVRSSGAESMYIATEIGGQNEQF